MASQPIDIFRPAGNFRPFPVAVSLIVDPVTGSRRRWQLEFWPTEAARGGSWWMTVLSATSDVLLRSVRLAPSRDLLAPYRSTVDGLPPGRLQLACPIDPILDSLTVPGLVVLTHEVG